MKYLTVCALLFTLSFYPLKSQTAELTNRINLELVKGNYLEVIALTNTYLAKDTNIVFLYKNALANRLSYNYNIALKQSSHLIELEPYNNDFKLEHCRNLIHSNLLDEAQTNLEQLFFVTDTTLIQAGILLGKIYDNDLNKAQSLKVYEQLCTLDSSNTYFLYHYASALTSLKKGMDAIPILQKALRLDPKHIKARYLLFRIYKALDEYDIAISHIDTLKQITPNNYKPYYASAQYNYSKNYNYRAIPEYKKAIELHYPYDDAWQTLGKCYFAIEKYKEALPYLKHTALPDNLSSDILSIIGSCYLKLNDSDSALIYYEKAYATAMPDPSFLDDYYNVKATVYANNKDYESSIACYKKLILQTEGLRWDDYYESKAMEHMVSIYTKQNEYDKAIALYQEILAKPNESTDPQLLKYYKQQLEKLKEEQFFKTDAK